MPFWTSKRHSMGKALQEEEQVATMSLIANEKGFLPKQAEPTSLVAAAVRSDGELEVGLVVRHTFLQFEPCVCPVRGSNSFPGAIGFDKPAAEPVEMQASSDSSLQTTKQFQFEACAFQKCPILTETVLLAADDDSTSAGDMDSRFFDSSLMCSGDFGSNVVSEVYGCSHVEHLSSGGDDEQTTPNTGCHEDPDSSLDSSEYIATFDSVEDGPAPMPSPPISVPSPSLTNGSTTQQPEARRGVFNFMPVLMRLCANQNCMNAVSVIPKQIPEPDLMAPLAPTSRQPKSKASRKAKAPTSARGEQSATAATTIMLRNVPLNYTRRMFLSMLDAEGFTGQYDFVYLPMDFSTGAGLGYAFLNMCHHSEALRIKQHFHGFTGWSMPSTKVCEVVWSEPYQGLQEHIKRFRNSPVMHPAVPDEYKPILLKCGTRVQFPEPTRGLAAPHLRQGGKTKGTARRVLPGSR